MKRQHLIVLLALVVCACASSLLSAASITFYVDGQAVNVPNYWVPKSADGRGVYMIGSPNTPDVPWEWQNAEGKIMMQGELDPDPSLAFAASVTDFGAPSTFGFTFTLPLAPLVPNPSTVFDSLSGSVTNGSGDDGGVTVTAMPPLGIPVDGDGIPEIQVYTLSDDGGLTWKNVGLDAGPTTFIPLAPFASGGYGIFNQGPIATIPGGPWTHMRADINFMLSGGGDAFSFNGAKVLEPIPEPSTVLLTLIAAAIGGCFRRRG